MMYYIQDPTIKKFVYFDTIPSLVEHLEGMVKRANNLTRKEYMQNLIDLGYGFDDPKGVTFTRSLSEEFNIGVIKNGKHVKTDVHEAAEFARVEFGQ